MKLVNDFMCVHSAGVHDFLKEHKDLQQGITPSTNARDTNLGENRAIIYHAASVYCFLSPRLIVFFGNFKATRKMSEATVNGKLRITKKVGQHYER